MASDDLSDVLGGFQWGSNVTPPNRSQMRGALELISVRYRDGNRGTPKFTTGIRTHHPVTGQPDRNLHPLGLAFDIETHIRQTDGTWRAIFSDNFIENTARELQTLGYRVKIEPHGTGPHMHVEANHRTDPIVGAELAAHRARIDAMTTVADTDVRNP